MNSVPARTCHCDGEAWDKVETFIQVKQALTANHVCQSITDGVSTVRVEMGEDDYDHLYTKVHVTTETSIGKSLENGQQFGLFDAEQIRDSILVFLSLFQIISDFRAKHLWAWQFQINSLCMFGNLLSTMRSTHLLRFAYQARLQCNFLWNDYDHVGSNSWNCRSFFVLQRTFLLTVRIFKFAAFVKSAGTESSFNQARGTIQQLLYKKISQKLQDTDWRCWLDSYRIESVMDVNVSLLLLLLICCQSGIDICTGTGICSLWFNTSGVSKPVKYLSLGSAGHWFQDQEIHKIQGLQECRRHQTRDSCRETALVGLEEICKWDIHAFISVPQRLWRGRYLHLLGWVHFREQALERWFEVVDDGESIRPAELHLMIPWDYRWSMGQIGANNK